MKPVVAAASVAAFFFGLIVGWYATDRVWRDEAMARGAATMSWYEDAEGHACKVFRWK